MSGEGASSIFHHRGDLAVAVVLCPNRGAYSRWSARVPMADVALVTGFTAYGGRGRNPAGEAAKALDGRSIGGRAASGRGLPVSYGTLHAALQGLLAALRPCLMVRLGLWPCPPTT